MNGGILLPLMLSIVSVMLGITIGMGVGGKAFARAFMRTLMESGAIGFSMIKLSDVEGEEREAEDGKSSD